jgi:hypothetical protein
MYCIVRKTHLGIEVHGPFERAAEASAYGYTRFGAIGLGTEWSVHVFRWEES